MPEAPVTSPHLCLRTSLEYSTFRDQGHSLAWHEPRWLYGQQYAGTLKQAVLRCGPSSFTDNRKFSPAPRSLRCRTRLFLCSSGFSWYLYSWTQSDSCDNHFSVLLSCWKERGIKWSNPRRPPAPWGTELKVHVNIGWWRNTHINTAWDIGILTSTSRQTANITLEKPLLHKIFLVSVFLRLRRQPLQNLMFLRLWV